MEIAPASVDQLVQSASGRWIAIDADVGSVAVQIKEIAVDRGIDLRLRCSEVTGVFKVVQVIDDEEQLVTTAQELDGRLVERVRQVTSPSYDLAGELDKIDDAADRQFWGDQREKVEEVGERLAHAIRKDLGEERKQVVLPRGVEA